MLGRAKRVSPVGLVKRTDIPGIIDVISEYSFGRSTNALDTPELGRPVRKNIEHGMRIHPFARLFPGFTIAMMKVVDLIAPYFSAAKDLKAFETMIYDLTAPIYTSAVQDAERSGSGCGRTESGIVQALATSTMLAPEEKTLGRVMAEMGGVIGGGAETLGRTVGIIHN